ncbi:hypothetical protein CXF59_13360 [Flavobacterium sp. ALD4]|uniref:hypothetical protein n=1 Tax=Flavobacterium sp. ALD4 TaxID=2058314 RepID=UPI000C327CF2|nr:hypothetical protein [Flavobacterium sp. ALD4]PKH66899.1 hypothetical protein CXF59_13360 [Flavobacterium sp. ALD4]
MKNYIYSAIALFLISSSIFGQAPSWSVNENNYQYTMTFVGFLNNDGNGLVNPNDKVAAFVNGEVCGVTNVIYVESEKRYCAYLTVFSNVNNETVSFKIYDSGKDKVKSVDKTVAFKANEHYGNLFQAYPFASPALKSEVEILDVSFAGVVKNNIVIEGSQVTVYLNKDQGVTALNTSFSLSLGASVYIGTVKQNSGANELNFTNPTLFNVLSEDQSIVQQWTIVVKTATGNGSYYKKEAVCYEGGSIKVLFPIEKEEVVLSTGGIILGTQVVDNGQAIFSNLSEGTYEVKVGGSFKEIVINLKNAL